MLRAAGRWSAPERLPAGAAPGSPARRVGAGIGRRRRRVGAGMRRQSPGARLELLRHRRQPHVGVVGLLAQDPHAFGDAVDEQLLIGERLARRAGLIVELRVTVFSVSAARRAAAGAAAAAPAASGSPPSAAGAPCRPARAGDAPATTATAPAPSQPLMTVLMSSSSFERRSARDQNSTCSSPRSARAGSSTTQPRRGPDRTETPCRS